MAAGIEPILPETVAPATRPVETVLKLTDTGNAERLALQHSSRLRYVPGIGWITWSGDRWERDQDGAAARAAKQTIRSIYAEASAVEDADRRKQIAQWATRSESAAARRAMLELAQIEEALIARADQLDADPFLLACANGTVDLRTGQLRAAEPGDLLSLGTRLAYRPDAKAPRWERFLEEVFAGDEDLIAFVRRWTGYCLTGDTTEQCFAILYGTGANGKSTLVDALKRTSGSHAQEAAFQTFALARSLGRDPRDDLAALRGARMVTTSEPGRGRWLDTEVVKKITGGDELVCRELFGKPFSYRPAFKLLVLTNHRPRIAADDDAMWRRVHLIPFEQTFKRGEGQHLADHSLAARLSAEAEGILAWRVSGCLEWQRSGLGSAGAIDRATSEYRAAEDQVGRFLNERCELDPNATVIRADLRDAYATWCDQEGERSLAASQLGHDLARRGIESAQIRVDDGVRKHAYRGLKLA